MKGLARLVEKNWDNLVEEKYQQFTPRRANQKLNQLIITAGLGSAVYTYGIAKTLLSAVTFLGIQNGGLEAGVYPEATQ